MRSRETGRGIEAEGWRQRDIDKGIKTGGWKQRDRDRLIETEVVASGSGSLVMLTETNPLTGTHRE